jgi:hypothetical protein
MPDEHNPVIPPASTEPLPARRASRTTASREARGPPWPGMCVVAAMPRGPHRACSRGLLAAKAPSAAPVGRLRLLRTLSQDHHAFGTVQAAAQHSLDLRYLAARSVVMPLAPAGLSEDQVIALAEPRPRGRTSPVCPGRRGTNHRTTPRSPLAGAKVAGLWFAHVPMW